MSEWLKEHAWKACVGETLPWVRIPLSPPTFANARDARGFGWQAASGERNRRLSRRSRERSERLAKADSSPPTTSRPGHSDSPSETNPHLRSRMIARERSVSGLQRPEKCRDLFQHVRFVGHKQIVARMSPANHSRAGNTLFEGARLPFGQGFIKPVVLNVRFGCADVMRTGEDRQHGRVQLRELPAARHDRRSRSR